MVGKWREREKAIKLRQTGIGVKQIARLLRVSRSSASIWVRHVKLTEKQKAVLKARELEGGMNGLRKVHKKWKKYHKVHPKPIKVPRKYRSVESFFDNWEPNMAYVLGYFAADGYMYRNKRGSYYIGFSSTDKELVVMVKKMMDVENAIEQYQPLNKNSQRKYVLQIGSRKIYEKLMELGFTERKSLTLKFPDISDEFLGHFVRGYLDGDGCVTAVYFKRRANKNLQYRFSVRFTCGNRTFLKSIQSRLIKSWSVGKGCLYTHAPNHSLLSYSAKDARQMYNFLYPTSTVPCLRRKKVLYDKGMKRIN